MRETLIEAGALDAFDFFILSDSTDASVWLAEEAGFRELRRRLGDDARVYYRHRSRNVARKAGNIADFCRRWGGHYDFMAVLDADSLMTGDVLVRLAAAMERRPEAGLIQTAPAAINGVTLFARLQQFASNAFGPLIAAGLDRWFGGDGSYWGHNAIVRTRAFIDHAGLPPLKGRKPFGGHILSHDFVEAALLRRAGWQIYMVPGLGGSYEESPPSLIDYASRDRRWCQGNMQHLAVLPTRGLAAMSRLHLALGIWSYLASPCWLVFLLVGVLLALQAEFIRPEYFTREFGLFPTWPVINPKLAAWLFGGTMAVLLAPRVLGLIWLWRSGRVSAGFGGRLAALASTFIEVLLSSLAAPVLMLTQTQAVIGILAGRDVGWKTQRREGGGAPFSEVLERHWGHTLSGLLLAGAVYQVTPILLAWMSPLALGLVLAIPLSLACASPAVGTALRRWRLLSTPPERMPPPLLRRAAELRGSYEAAIADRRDCLARLAGDSELRNFHLGLLPAEPMPRRGEVDVDLVVALAKIDQCETVRQAAELLAPREAYAVLGSTQGITRLMRLARDARPQVASAPR
jgi:membrane glycosyltransferase